MNHTNSIPVKILPEMNHTNSIPVKNLPEMNHTNSIPVKNLPEMDPFPVKNLGEMDFFRGNGSNPIKLLKIIGYFPQLVIILSFH